MASVRPDFYKTSGVKAGARLLRGDNKTIQNTITNSDFLRSRDLNSKSSDRDQLIYVTPPMTEHRARRWNAVTAQSFHMTAGESITRLPWVRLAVCRAETEQRIAVQQDTGQSRVFDWPPNAVAFFPPEKTWHCWSDGLDIVDVFQDIAIYKQIASSMDWLDLSNLPFIPDLEDPVICSIITMLESEIEGDAWGSTLLAESLSYSLAINVVRVIANKSGVRMDGVATDGGADRLPIVVEYIRNNLEMPLSLDELAVVSGLSVRQLIQTFKVVTGMTPHRYVLFQRVSEAKFLLLNRTIPLTEIAYTCGFSSQAHFTTRFREIVGVLPSEYRRTGAGGADNSARISA